MQDENERDHHKVECFWEVIEVIGDSDDRSGYFVLRSKESMQDFMGATMLAYDIPSRPSVDEVWNGPGIYRFSILTSNPNIIKDGDVESERRLGVTCVESIDSYNLRAMKKLTHGIEVEDPF